MGMFDTIGRGEKTLAKLERMNRASSHEEPDRVPISDFCWGRFIERWCKDPNVSPDPNPSYNLGVFEEGV